MDITLRASSMSSRKAARMNFVAVCSNSCGTESSTRATRLLPKGTCLKGISLAAYTGLYVRLSLELLKRVNAPPPDACGRISFGRKNNHDEYFPVAKVDWHIGDKNSLFGRWEFGHLNTPSDYDGRTILSIS